MKNMTKVAYAIAILTAAVTLAAQQPPAPQTAAAGATGTWTIEGTDWSIVLKQDGAALSGKVIQGPQEFEISDTKVEGATVSFKAKPTAERTIIFIGTVANDEIAFTRTVELKEGGAPGGAALMDAGGPPEFKARRAAPETDVWSGSVRNAPNPQNPNANPNVRPATVAIRKIPDPHWRWRGGSKDLPMRVFNLQNQPIPVNSFALDNDQLTFEYTRTPQEDQVKCSLARQTDGQFAGVCRASGNFSLLITLTPPKEGATG